MRCAPAFVLLVCLGCHEVAQKPATSAAEAEQPPVLQLPRDVRPARYAIELQVDPSKASFRGQATISVALERPRNVIWLHGRKLRVTAASVDGRPAKYQQV